MSVPSSKNRRLLRFAARHLVLCKVLIRDVLRLLVVDRRVLSSALLPAGWMVLLHVNLAVIIGEGVAEHVVRSVRCADVLVVSHAVQWVGGAQTLRAIASPLINWHWHARIAAPRLRLPWPLTLLAADLDDVLTHPINRMLLALGHRGLA